MDPFLLWSLGVFAIAGFVACVKAIARAWERRGVARYKSKAVQEAAWAAATAAEAEAYANADANAEAEAADDPEEAND